MQTGSSVTATFNKPHPCDPQDGSPIQYNNWDFAGTLDGDRLEGKAHYCGYGKGNPLLGIHYDARFKLTVSANGQTLSGTWHNVQANGGKGADEPWTINRVGCEPRQFKIGPNVRPSWPVFFPTSPADLMPCQDCPGGSEWVLVHVDFTWDGGPVRDPAILPTSHYECTYRYVATWQCPGQTGVTVRSETKVVRQACIPQD